MRFRALILVTVMTAAITSWGQSFRPHGPNPGNDIELGFRPPELTLTRADVAPRMSAELTLQTYEQQAMRQSAALSGYTANTVIDAELPDTAQRGQLELKREYVAPKSLQFTPVKFTGDKFVKGNVILRVLQSEVQHVEKEEASLTAITIANYKFSYKGRDLVNGQPVHVYNVKPREKRAGLFRGKVYLDVSTGHLRRAEGTLVKSPSFFIKKIEFVQDYADFNGFTLPVHIHSVANTRVVGRAVVDITTRDYEASGQTALAGLVPTSGN